MQTELTQPAALISVYYKDGIDRLAKALYDKGYVIYSTGKTSTYLEKIGIPVTDVSELTGSPEMMDGRVKTLHPTVFGSILARTHKLEDIKVMQDNGMVMMNVVVVNLYPFQEEVDKGKETTHENIIEKIDVGGPSMIRAAAKNHERVSVICDPADYNILAAMIESGVEIPLAQREEWARLAFATTGGYDTAIEAYFAGRLIEAQAQDV